MTYSSTDLMKIAIEEHLKCNEYPRVGAVVAKDGYADKNDAFDAAIQDDDDQNFTSNGRRSSVETTPRIRHCET